MRGDHSSWVVEEHLRRPQRRTQVGALGLQLRGQAAVQQHRLREHQEWAVASAASASALVRWTVSGGCSAGAYTE